VGIIWAVLNGLLSRLGNSNRPRTIRGCIILLALWAYAGLTGGEASVLRATVMCSLFTIGNMLLRAAGHMNSLFAAALVLLLWDPMMLWQLSFQLSFMAVLGIILFYKPLLHLWHAPNKVMYHIWSATAVSLAAQLTTTPLSLLVFKSFPVWFLPANIAVAFIVAAAVYGSALLVVLFKVPFLGAVLTWFMTQLLFALGWITAFFGALPAAYPGVRIDLLQCLLLYGFIACCAAWIAWPGRFSRWATAITAVAVLINWGWKADALDHTARFAVHDARNGNLFSLQQGRQLEVVADAIWTGPILGRRLEMQERGAGTDHTFMRPWSEVVEQTECALDLGPWRIGFTGPRLSAHNDALGVDALLLTADGSYDMERIRRAFDPRGPLVLSSTINGLERWRIRKWCAEHGIACHDVHRQGAFILETRI
jgi:competence protein ComEC